MSAASSIAAVLERCRRTGTFGSNPITVHDRDLLGDTPLHVASQMGDIEAVQVLLRAGADPDALGDRGRTAIFCTDSVSVLGILIEAGANVQHRDDEGKTVLDVAKLLDRGEIIEYLSRRSSGRG